MRSLQKLSLAIGLVATACPMTAQTGSAYVPMADGTRLAVDWYLPDSHDSGDRYPALLELTRYWRGRENPETGEPMNSLRPVDRHFLQHGYALVKVDVRGSGASFGTRNTEYGRQEVRDGKHVVDWVVAQDWCEGSIGAYGTSYTGTTAELLAASGHPAVKAVIPGWSDFDAYRSPVRPYGLYCATLIDQWSTMVGMLDRNDVGALGGSVRRVEGDDGQQLAEAVAQHAANPEVRLGVLDGEYRDDTMVGGSDTYAHVSALHWKQEIESSNAAMLVFASWLDAGTADGALTRLRCFRNPQHVVVLASSHGGRWHASPFTVSQRPRPSNPPVDEQFAMRLAFFDHHLKQQDNEVTDWPKVRYFHMGTEEMRSSATWPPADTKPVRWFPTSQGTLQRLAGTADHDTYEVDFGVGTGRFNRWATQMGTPVLGLDHRERADEAMLTYTSAPLEQALDLSGTPVVSLRVTSDQRDGAVLVYLEDVAPDGQSRYVTEGGLRLIHRKLADGHDCAGAPPAHSFARTDSLPVMPGEPMTVTFALHPTSVRIAAGHALRIAIAGADTDAFGRTPADGQPTLRIDHGSDHPTWIDLPVVGG